MTRLQRIGSSAYWIHLMLATRPLICNLYLTHFLSSKRTTTAEVQDQDPLALGCFPARPVWTSRRPCAGHARQAGASSHFGQLTQMIASMRLLGQLALCSFSQNKLTCTSRFSSEGSGHPSKRGPNHAFHSCEKHLASSKKFCTSNLLLPSKKYDATYL